MSEQNHNLHHDPFVNYDLAPETPDEVFAPSDDTYKRFNRAWHARAREASTPEEDSP